MDELQQLMGKDVEVLYHTIVYRGILTGVSEHELYLKTQMEWVSLPLEGITSVQSAQ